MSELQHKFNLYDYLAYILVGFYQLGILWISFVLTFGLKSADVFELLKLEFSIALILVAYLVGHLVQAASNIFERWEKKKKEEKPKKLLFIIEKARDFFSLPKDFADKDVWQYCYLYALSNDFSGHVALFNSMYSLYRGFWIASSIGIICSFFIVIPQLVRFIATKFVVFPDFKVLAFMGITFVLAVLFNRRKKRFFDYLGEKTLITFDILSKNILNKG